jgi:hypothetical protein
MFGDDLLWKGRLLIFNWHFKKEYEDINKPLEFILDILNQGEHQLISKKQNKYNVFYPYKRKHLCMSYVEHENIILIHIKPKRK